MQRDVRGRGSGVSFSELVCSEHAHEMFRDSSGTICTQAIPNPCRAPDTYLNAFSGDGRYEGDPYSIDPPLPPVCLFFHEEHMRT
jgi:hypothetical protein